VTGDFNGDGKLDVAVIAGVHGGALEVLLGNGDGTLQSPSIAGSIISGLTTSAQDIVTGDFNRDGKPDVALVITGGVGEFGVLLGNGDGTFQPPIAQSFSYGGPAVAADFNGDGKLDLAVTRFSTVSVFVGNGDGTFQGPVGYAPGASAVTVGDFNGDGKLDLAVVDYSDNVVSVLLGNGDGTFENHQDFATGAGPSAVPIGDFNGDGRMDLAVANSTDNTVSVLLQSTVELSPRALDFAYHILNQPSSPQTITLTNVGNSALMIDSVAATAGFAQTNDCGSNVMPAASCSINVTFTPLAPGTASGTLTIVDSAIGSPQTIALTGIGSQVSLSPSSLTFAGQNVGTSSNQLVKLTNTAARRCRSLALRQPVISPRTSCAPVPLPLGHFVGSMWSSCLPKPAFARAC
jgi:hypothetical protein